MPTTIVEFPGRSSQDCELTELVDLARVAGRTDGLARAHELAVAEFDRLCAQYPVNLAAVEAASRICTAIFEACMAEGRGDA